MHASEYYYLCWRRRRKRQETDSTISQYWRKFSFTGCGILAPSAGPLSIVYTASQRGNIRLVFCARTAVTLRQRLLGSGWRIWSTRRSFDSAVNVELTTEPRVEAEQWHGGVGPKRILHLHAIVFLYVLKQRINDTIAVLSTLNSSQVDSRWSYILTGCAQ